MGLRGRGAIVLLAVLALSASAAALAPDREGIDDEDARAEGPTARELEEGAAGAIVVPAGTVVDAGDVPSEASSSPPVLVIEAAFRVQGTREAPARFHLPVFVRPPPGDPVHVRHAVFEAHGGNCALSIEASAGTVENSTFKGSRDGLCIKSSPHTDPDGDARSILLPFLGTEYAPGPEATSPAGKTSIQLEGNSYVENSRAGLRVSTRQAPEGLPASVVASSSGNFRSNGEGLRVEGEATRLIVEDAEIARNRVGLVHEGGQARFDHALFENNEAWDVQSSGRPGDLKWSGSTFSRSCIDFEGRRAEGCQRGSLPGSRLTLVFALATSVVYLLSEAGRYLVTRIGFSLRLYSRIPRDELLDHETRQRLFDEVERVPGASIAALARAVEVPRTTAVYHLSRLESADLLESRREGVHRRFYPAKHEGEREPKSTREHVLAAIEDSPGIHASEVADSLDVSRQVVSYHVGELKEIGRLEVQQNERVKHLYPSADQRP